MSATVPPASVPFWEDLLEIFYAPRAVFERRKNSGFGLPLLVLFVVGTGLFFVGRSALEPVYDGEIDRGIAQAMKSNPQMTPEMAERGKEVGKSILKVSVPAIVLFAPLILGLTLWIFGKFVEARQELGAACMVAAYACFPRLLESILGVLQSLILPAEQLTSHYALQLGPARFIDPDLHPVLIALLGRVDLITLWCTALLALGLSITGKISVQKAAIAAGLVWLLASLFQLWGPIRAAS
jgi:hypothetical protein